MLYIQVALELALSWTAMRSAWDNVAPVLHARPRRRSRPHPGTLRLLRDPSALGSTGVIHCRLSWLGGLHIPRHVFPE